MEQLKKITSINLIIMLIYTLLIQGWVQMADNQQYIALVVLVFSMYVIAAHVAINLAIAIGFFFKKDKELGKAFLLSTVIILVVGFSSCFGNAILSETI